MMFNPSLGCSSISFRHQDLPTALRTMSEPGFEEIDVRSLGQDLDTISAEVIHAGQRAEQLARRMAGSGVGVVMDFSHIVAAGEDPLDYIERHAGRIAHVHIRDAVPGNINLSIGNGHADFAAGLRSLTAHGYTGHFSLELETRDVTDDERPAAAAKASSFITDLI